MRARGAWVVAVMVAAASGLAGCARGDGADPAGTDRVAPPLAALLPAAQAAPPLPAGAVRVQPVRIMDERGLDRPMVAYTVLIPPGWRTAGGVRWGALGQCGSEYGLDWSATSPDGLSSIAIVPAPSYQDFRTSMTIDVPPPQCMRGSWASAREYLEAYAQRQMPRARRLDYRERPDLVHRNNELVRQFGDPSSEFRRASQRFDAGELLVADVVNGRPVRAILRVEMLISQSQTLDIANPGRVAFEQIDGLPYSVMIARAPEGSLALNALDTFARNARQGVEWASAIAAFELRKRQEADRRFEETIARNGAAGAEALREMSRRHNSRMDAIREFGRLSSGAYEDRMLASDVRQREYVERIRGVETYHDPGSGPGHLVQLDQNYDHAWRVRDGTYVLTNDPNFDPNRYGLESEKLRVVQ